MPNEIGREVFWSLTKIILLLVFGFFLFTIKDILLIFFFALIFSVALAPIVRDLEKKHKIPKIATISAFFVVIFTFFVFSISILIEVLMNEGLRFLENLPVLVNNIIEILNFQEFLPKSEVNNFFEDLNSSLPEQIRSQSGNLLGIGLNLIDVIIQFLTFAFITFYMMHDWDKIKIFILSFFNHKSQSEINKIISRIELKLGAWLRGQFSLMIIISIATYVGLTVLGVNYAVALAITAGLLEAVPIVGPLLAVVPAILVAASPDAPAWQPFAVLILYFVIQQMEGNLIVPRVMNEAVGIHPVLIIFAIMVGIKVAGPVGSFIAIPVAAIIMIFYEEWMITKGKPLVLDKIKNKKQKPTKAETKEKDQEDNSNKKTGLAKKE